MYENDVMMNLFKKLKCGTSFKKAKLDVILRTFVSLQNRPFIFETVFKRSDKDLRCSILYRSIKHRIKFFSSSDGRFFYLLPLPLYRV